MSMPATDPTPTRGTGTKPPRSWLPAGVVILLVAVFIALYVYIPRYTSAQLATLTAQVPLITSSSDPKFALAKELKLFDIDLQARIWVGAFQILGGGALLVGLFFTWRNLKVTQDKLNLDRESQQSLQKANENKLLIDREGLLTNRFNTATSQLGAQIKEDTPNVEARLGAIYALEWIGQDDPRLYWPVMEILSAYIRHNAPVSANKPAKEPRTDIQAAITVLCRSKHYLLYPIGLIDEFNPIESNPPIRPIHPDQERLIQQHFDLRHTDLRQAEFYDAHLERADFWGANLEGAKFWGSVLYQAKLSHANLRNTDLKEVHFAGAELIDTDLTGANLKGAVLRRTDLSRAQGLTKIQIDSANQGLMEKVVLPPL